MAPGVEAGGGVQAENWNRIRLLRSIVPPM
jgi:hypothetical protein